MKLSILPIIALSALTLGGCRDRLLSGPNPPDTTKVVSQTAIASYNFDTNLDDQTGNGHNGQWDPYKFGSLPPYRFTTDRFGSSGKAVSFDTAQYPTTQPYWVRVENKSDIEFGMNDAFSISAWIRPSGKQSTAAIIVRKGLGSGALFGLDSGYDLAVSGDVVVMNCTNGADCALTGTTRVTDGQWHFITVSVDVTTKAQLYVDGALDASTTILARPSNNIPTKAPLYIGGSGSTDFDFQGAMDDIEIYNRVLTPAEIQTMFHANGWTGPVTGGWPGPSGTSNKLSAVHFLDSQIGYACGYNGTILRTTDAGLSWQAQKSGTSVNLFEIAFTDALNGVAGGDNSTLLKTTDGGTIWSQIPNVPFQTFGGSPESIRDVKYVDRMHILAVGGASGSEGFALMSTDGGDTWSRLVLANGSTNFGSSLYGIATDGAANVTIVGYNGALLQSYDGGMSWSKMNFSMAPTLFDVDMWVDPSVPAINRDFGIIVGSGGVIYKTTDNGKTWQSENSGITSDLRCVKIVSRNMIWAVGENGYVLESLDAGVTWAIKPGTDGKQMNGIGLRDPNHLVTCEDLGKLVWWTF